MFASWRRLFFLSWYLVAGSSSYVDASTPTSFPETVEFDLIFPRNESYAPAPLFPLVFAAQNTRFAALLRPEIYFDIWRVGANKTVKSSSLELRWANFSSSDPFYMYRGIGKHFNVEGTWALLWTFVTSNCSYGTGADGTIGKGGTQTSSVTIFTTKNGAPQPDLVAASDASTCVQRDNRTFNLTGVMNEKESCAILSATTPLPAPNACAVKVESAAASSISAAMTVSACRKHLLPVVSCPPDENGAARAGKFRAKEVAWLMAASGCLTCMLM